MFSRFITQLVQNRYSARRIVGVRIRLSRFKLPVRSQPQIISSNMIETHVADETRSTFSTMLS